MIDDIGLGNFLANAIYLWLSILTIVIFMILLFFKKKLWAFWTLSTMANFILFLYVLGSRVEWHKYVTVIIWPIINLIWLITLLILLINKKKKK